MTAAPKAGTMFQSTPPSGERSDARKQVLELAEAQFQSTPPSGERSDFSVRCGCLRLALFQSTPPSGERSDHLDRSVRSGWGGFNPRPPPERGATSQSAFSPKDPKFQSTPPSGERSDGRP